MTGSDYRGRSPCHLPLSFRDKFPAPFNYNPIFLEIVQIEQGFNEFVITD